MSPHQPSQPAPAWPDPLSAPDAAAARALLERFWQTLALLPDLLVRGELILAEQLTVTLRATVIEIMLAMNGIAYPVGTAHLNGYLGASQRAALERTLVAPAPDTESWVGRAVALIVIYRWYAPQIVERFGGALPLALEQRVLDDLAARVSGWPTSIETE